MNIRTILLIAGLTIAIVFIGFQFSKSSSELLTGINIKNNPTQATSSISHLQVTKFLSANPGRQNLVICVDNESYTTRFWLRTSSTTDMTVGANSSGFRLDAGECWDMLDDGILWTREVFAYASSSTSTLHYIEY